MYGSGADPWTRNTAVRAVASTRSARTRPSDRYTKAFWSVVTTSPTVVEEVQQSVGAVVAAPGLLLGQPGGGQGVALVGAE